MFFALEKCILKEREKIYIISSLTVQLNNYFIFRTYDVFTVMFSPFLIIFYVQLTKWSSATNNLIDKNKLTQSIVEYANEHNTIDQS